MVSRLFSPYEFNPLNLNPLREALVATVDFEELQKATSPVRLFLAATNVRTGKVKIFKGSEICAEAVLASACLPFLFQAIAIDGEHYWDGGYMGNPAIFPLIYECDSRDVVVHINPIERAELPRSAGEILNRINEISFNSSLMREMRAIHFVTELIESGQLGQGRMKQMLIHAIAADELAELGARSKLNAEHSFLAYLRDRGRAHAEAWLATTFKHLGERSTVDIQSRYLCERSIAKLTAISAQAEVGRGWQDIAHVLDAAFGDLLRLTERPTHGGNRRSRSRRWSSPRSPWTVARAGLMGKTSP